MSLIHYVKPFLDLGICKEYMMARKTTGTSPTRSKKATVATTQAETSAEIRKNGKAVAANEVSTNNSINLNLEDEIRRRAYELYLERRATATNSNGDENQDWFVAEREIRSRQSGQ